MDLRFPATLSHEPDGSAVTVTFDGLPGATFGATEEEALAWAVDLLESALAWAIAEDAPLPRPQPPRTGDRLVTPRPLAAARLALYQAMRARGLDRDGLALRLNISRREVDRLLDLRRRAAFATVETALARLGVRLEVTAVDAAALGRAA